MVIHLDSELEAALIEGARVRGIAPDVMAVNALRAQFILHRPNVLSHEERMQILRSVATDCGVALSDADVSSEGIYD